MKFFGHAVGNSQSVVYQPFTLGMLRHNPMTPASDRQATAADFAPRHFYYSRYLCVTNTILGGLVTVGAAANPAAIILALPFVAWACLCVKELFQRKPAITVSSEGIVVRKLLFAGANMPFEEIEEVTKTEVFGLGNSFKFRLKSGQVSRKYEIMIYNNQHLNCSIEAHGVVAAIRAARPGCNLLER
jgi:hypothetical protein